jgi:hypothetical protein
VCTGNKWTENKNLEGKGSNSTETVCNQTHARGEEKCRSASLVHEKTTTPKGVFISLAGIVPKIEIYIDGPKAGRG